MGFHLIDDDSSRSSRIEEESEGQAEGWTSRQFDAKAVLGIETPLAVIVGECDSRFRTGESLSLELRSLGYGGPIIVLGGSSDIEPLLTAGADAVLPGASSWAGIRAQAEAIMRRGAGMAGGTVDVGGLLFDPSDSSFMVGNERLPLSDLPGRILVLLMHRRGRLVSSRELSRKVWGQAEAGSKLAFQMNRLRHALTKAGLDGHAMIRNEKGAGYTLVDPGAR
ncbi:Putative transcriptional regulatory protein QseB (plasmid) [Magnetospirillum sp. XM-1]|uniref:winged helix-turn-helix domain-containing protein n=1 Tax=Magnetospirillum sp. XM-1 TaxID=1663591 RepID=UPI00073DC483|nr:winged helix-turn-helix domain-containing protein [Magnetospirillum sp. XM-1]CUW41977.1 Putative transcriptional regulatory protein QseB [Magnetospirillum sp. XM-1]